MTYTVTEWKDGKHVNVTKGHGVTVSDWDQYLGDYDTVYGVVVYNADTNDFSRVGGGYFPVPHEIDAPQEILDYYEATQKAQQMRSQADALETDAKMAALRLFNIERGKRVQVTGGRKVPKGTVGTVKVHWEGQWGWRVLLVTDDGSEHWTDADNVTVMLPGQTLVPA